MPRTIEEHRDAIAAAADDLYRLVEEAYRDKGRSALKRVDFSSPYSGDLANNAVEAVLDDMQS